MIPAADSASLYELFKGRYKATHKNAQKIEESIYQQSWDDPILSYIELVACQTGNGFCYYLFIILKLNKK